MSWTPLKSVDLRAMKLGTEFWLLNMTFSGERELVEFQLQKVRLTRWSETQIDGRSIPGANLVCLERVAFRMIQLCTI